VNDDPFGVLGLPVRADLLDEDVRAAWKRIAAATHPDRDDGGDPARFAAAASAYDTLRTSFGRGEARADLELGGHPGQARRQSRRGTHRLMTGPGARYSGYIGHVTAGRGLALRVAGTAAIAPVTVAIAGWTPATIALLVGAATWLLAARNR
jgi:curved DNA-binding protein CbpA